MEAVDPILLRQQLHLGQVGQELVSLSVHIGIHVMGNLAGCVAETNGRVEGCGSRPQRTPGFIHLLRPPKSNVMSPPRIGAIRLLERQVLFSTPQKQPADGGRVILAAKNRTSGKGVGDSGGVEDVIVSWGRFKALRFPVISVSGVGGGPLFGLGCGQTLRLSRQFYRANGSSAASSAAWAFPNDGQITGRNRTSTPKALDQAHGQACVCA